MMAETADDDQDQERKVVPHIRSSVYLNHGGKKSRAPKIEDAAPTGTPTGTIGIVAPCASVKE
jgi:hypothetical protein